jgi:hypothetical protein
VLTPAFAAFAFIAQWIEQSRPKGKILVRFQVRAQGSKTPVLYWCLDFYSNATRSELRFQPLTVASNLFSK